MIKYTKDQITECKDYLGYGVKEGYISEDICQDIIKRKAWNEVYEMMAIGDDYANDNERE